MTAADIAQQRLVNQQLTGTAFTTPQEIVSWLGGVQAQDYAMARWAVGVRLPGATDELIERAIDDGAIIRTHVLRPTWHLVAPQDIRWMLQLSGARVMTAIGTSMRRLGLDETQLRRTNGIIETSLAGGKHQTRQELMGQLVQAGIEVNELRAAHILMGAEVAGIICNGPRRGKQITYALLDERVPATATLGRDESLAKLALRYFTSHGPATPHDFSWWSGLTLTDARRALEIVGSGLESATVEGTTYWFSGSASGAEQSVRKGLPTVHFLPAYDEFIVSYKGRTASLDPAFTKSTITVNGVFKPIIVVGGKVTGIWKRTMKKEKEKAIVEPSFFNPAEQLEQDEIVAATERLGQYLGVEIEVR